MTGFFQTIWNYTVTIFFTVLRVAVNSGMATYRFVRAFLWVEVCIVAAMMVMLIIGWLTNQEWIIAITAIVASITLFLCWKFSDVTIAIISGICCKIPGVRVVTDSIKGELSKLVSFLLLAAMVIAFLGTAMTIKGPSLFSLRDIMVWATFLTFTGIFVIWLNSKRKIAGWVMMFALCYFLAGHYLWPLQIQGWTDWLDGVSTRWSMTASQESRNDKLVEIANNTPLYQKRSFSSGFKLDGKTTETQTIAKLIERTTDPISKEGMVKVILPVAKGVYIDGKEAYVPIRLVNVIEPVASPINTSASASTTLKQCSGDICVYSPGAMDEINIVKDGPLSRWIKAADDKKTTIDLIAIDGAEFVRVFEDGSEVHMNVPVVTNFSKFKIKAITKQCKVILKAREKTLESV